MLFDEEKNIPRCIFAFKFILSIIRIECTSQYIVLEHYQLNNPCTLNYTSN